MISLPTHHLVAGACYDPAGSYSKCALQPTECEPMHSYRTSRQLRDADSAEVLAICSSQEKIRGLRAMGRCDSASERFICTSHLSACRISFSFSPLDPECTVQHDWRRTGNFFTSSYFGYCRERSTDTELCAWQYSECPDGYEFQSADPFFAGNEPSCRCDDVKVGACVSDDPSAGEYFCAVTKDVCASEPGLVYRKAVDVEAELGVTCRLCAPLPPPPETKVVAAGACLLNRDFVRCALTPSNCDGSISEKFMSPARLEDPLFYSPEEANVCLTPEGVKGVRAGRCAAVSNYNLCVPDATACNLSMNFRANDNTCTVTRDLDPMPQFGYKTTHFGYCSADDFNNGYNPGTDESYCAWSFPDCKVSDPDAPKLNFHDADPGWATASPNCQCDDVRTGACINANNPEQRYCAVVPEACDAGYNFVNVRDLEVPTGPNLVCRLCDRLSLTETAEHLNAQLRGDTSAPTAAYSATDVVGKYYGMGLDESVIIGLVVGGIIVTVLLLTIVLYSSRSRKSDKTAGSTLEDAGVTNTDKMESEVLDEEFVAQKNKNVV